MEVTHLIEWCIGYVGDDPYIAPELRRPRLIGVVAMSSRFELGSHITTSSLKGKRGEYVVTSTGSLYSLGQPDADYEKLFPGAKKRLFDSLEEA